MSNKRKFPTEERLSQVLAAFGARPEKWPYRERAGLEQLLKSQLINNEVMRSQYKAAQSLDQILNSVATTENNDVPDMSMRVMQRIAAAREEQSSQGGLNITDFNTSNSAPPSRPPLSQGAVRHWQMAALLAATFLLGIYIGATRIAEPAAEGIAALTGASDTTNVEFTLFQSGPIELFGEDL